MGKGIKQQQQRGKKRQHAGDIQLVRAPFLASLFETGDDQRNRHGGDRQIDEKRPTPIPMLDNNAARERSEHRGDAPDAADNSLYPCALLGRKQNADDDKRERVDGAAAETLESAEYDQRLHAVSRPAQRRANDEYANPDKHEPPAAVEVG